MQVIEYYENAYLSKLIFEVHNDANRKHYKINSLSHCWDPRRDIFTAVVVFEEKE